MAQSIRNWIAGDNPHHLEQPPDWWLRGLSDFDDQLVVLPSLQRPVYILARRLQHTSGLGDLAVVAHYSDTTMLIKHKVVPVAPFEHKAGPWSMESLETILRELNARDTWRYKDSDAAVNEIEQYEAAQEAKRQKALRDDFDARARDAWRSLKARTGQRNKRASDYHGVAQATIGYHEVTSSEPEKKPTVEVASTTS